MRVFMLGWEFPPFISGGLGTACYGLTKAMSSIGMDVLSMSAYGLGGAALARRMSEPRFRRAFAFVTGGLLLAASVLIVSRL